MRLIIIKAQEITFLAQKNTSPTVLNANCHNMPTHTQKKLYFTKAKKNTYLTIHN